MREELSDDIAVNQLSIGRKHYTMSILRDMEETVKEPVLGLTGIGFSERKNNIRGRIKPIFPISKSLGLITPNNIAIKFKLVHSNT